MAKNGSISVCSSAFLSTFLYFFLQSDEKAMDVDQPASTFDLDAYAQQYRGHTKVVRLEFIGRNSTDCSVKAFQLAIQEVQRSRDTQRYGDLCRAMREIHGQNATDVDQLWVEKTDKA